MSETVSRLRHRSDVAFPCVGLVQRDWQALNKRISCAAVRHARLRNVREVEHLVLAKRYDVLWSEVGECVTQLVQQRVDGIRRSRERRVCRQAAFYRVYGVDVLRRAGKVTG